MLSPCRRVVTVERCFGCAAQHCLKFVRAQHDDFFIGFAFAALVGILNDVVAIGPHHLGETQRFTSKRAMRILLIVNRVKDTNKVQRRFGVHAKYLIT